MLKTKLTRSKKHRKYIGSLPCCVTGVTGETQAAHIRSGFFGLGIKPSDQLCVPLSWRVHAVQHSGSEEVFWSLYGGVERAKKLANDLYQVSGDEEAGKEIIARFWNDFRK